MSRPIVLTGFMSSGKTTVAKALANRLKVTVADLDEEILAAEGKAAWEIIDEQGEYFFRIIETRVLRQLFEQANTGVISLGGGTWIRSENREIINNYNPIVVWLDAPFTVCWERIQLAEHRRPLAVNKINTEKLYELRRKQYALANIRILIKADSTVEQIVDEIEQALVDERT